MSIFDTIRIVSQASGLAGRDYFSQKSVKRTANIIKAVFADEMFTGVTQNLSPQQALMKAIWMDIQRWILILRNVYFSQSVPMARFYSYLKPIFVSVEYDPYCNYCMSIGVDCSRCPIFLYRIEVFKTTRFSSVDDCYLRCSRHGVKHWDLELLFNLYQHDDTKVSSDVGQPYMFLDKLFNVARNEMEVGKAVSLYYAITQSPLSLT